jgi:hypothetical protein
LKSFSPKKKKRKRVKGKLKDKKRHFSNLKLVKFWIHYVEKNPTSGWCRPVSTFVNFRDTIEELAALHILLAKGGWWLERG